MRSLMEQTVRVEIIMHHARALQREAGLVEAGAVVALVSTVRGLRKTVLPLLLSIRKRLRGRLHSLSMRPSLRTLTEEKL